MKLSYDRVAAVPTAAGLAVIRRGVFPAVQVPRGHLQPAAGDS